MSRAQVASFAAAEVLMDLPEGWMEYTTEQGLPYFYNTVRRLPRRAERKSWSFPRLCATAPRERALPVHQPRH